MSIENQVKSLTDEIEASFETRKAVVADIAKETRQTLGNFSREHEKMARDLKRSLASNTSNRARQVQNMRARNVKDLQNVTRKLREMAQQIATFLTTAEKERKQEFAALFKEIQGVVEAIEKDTAQALADYKGHAVSMTRDLRASLSSETRERIENVQELLSRFADEHKEMAHALRSELSSFQQQLEQTVTMMMADFSADHQQAHEHWNGLTKVMAAKRAGHQAPAPKAAVSTSTPTDEHKKPRKPLKSER